MAPLFFRVLAILCLARLAKADAEVAEKTHVCNICSTTPISWITQRFYTARPGGVHYSPAPDGSITYVYTGSDWVTSSANTTTFITTQTTTRSSDRIYGETQTTTTRLSQTTTLSVCSPTPTPAKYPTDMYCGGCATTNTVTTTLTTTVNTWYVRITWDSTSTVRPTLFGTTSTYIQYHGVETTGATVLTTLYTKTIYESTSTTTLPPYATPSKLRFKLQALSPYTSGFYVKFREEPLPGCPGNTLLGCYPILGASSSFEGASTFRLAGKKLRLVRSKGDDYPCQFIRYFYEDGAYGATCNATTSAQQWSTDVQPLGRCDIDCKGDLVSWLDTATTFAVDRDNNLIIVREIDPVHNGGWTETGDREIYVVRLRVVPVED